MEEMEKTMGATAKQLWKQLAGLRADWKTWRTATVTDPGRIELTIVCPTAQNRYHGGEPVTCGDPTCEGCMATRYRFDRMKEIEAEAGQVKVQMEKAG